MKNSVRNNKKVFTAALVLATAFMIQEKVAAKDYAPEGNTGNEVVIVNGNYTFPDGKTGKVGQYDTIAGANEKYTDKSVSNNKVTSTGTIKVSSIKGGIAKVSTGPYGSETKVTANENEVHITGTKESKITGISGGDGTYGANKNIVEIKNLSSINGKLYGGLAHLGETNENKVSIIGVETAAYSSEIIGGKSLNNSESNNNEVIVEGSGTSDLSKAIIMGGHSDEKSNNNHVKISKVNVVGQVFGGKTDSTGEGEASNNTVEIIGTGETTLSAKVIQGGHGYGEVVNNSVTISGVKVSNGIITGGKAGYNKIAKNNTVTFTGTGETEVNSSINGGLGGKIVEENKVIMSGVKSVKETIYGGESEEVANKNSVELIGTGETELTAENSIVGGYASSDKEGRQANENEVMVKNIKSSGAIYGGWSEVRSANSNTVRVIGENNRIEEILAVNGGFAKNEYADENKVYIKNALVHTVRGGYAKGNQANGNIIYLEDVAVDKDVYGGWSYGQSQNNTVVLSGEMDLSQAVLHGGYTDDYKAINAEQGTKGNVLKIGLNLDGNYKAMTNGRVKKLQNFEKIEFHGVKWDKENAAMTILEESDLSKTKFDANNIYFTNLEEARDSISVGEKMTLIDTLEKDMKISANNIVPATEKVSKLRAGTAGEIKVTGKADVEGTNLIYKIGDGMDSDSGDEGAREQTHNVVIGNTATFAAINSGQNYVEEGLASIGDANKVNFYMGGSAGDEKYDTGSHIDTKVYNGAVGLGNMIETNNGTLGYMVFYEYGNGDYEVYNEGGEKGHGDIIYQGLALSSKYKFNNNVYGELILRGGQVKNEAKNVLVDGSGKGYDYKTSSPYLSGQVGIGKIIELSEKTTVDTYGKYSYTRIDKDEFELSNEEKYKLDSIESSIVKVGSKVIFNENNLNFYCGTAIEGELGGESTGTADGLKIKSADVGGASVSLEIGATLKPTSESAWSFDASIKGYAGKHEGYRGNIGISYSF